MNKLEELILKYCPEGVKRVKLGEVLDVNRGKRLTKSQLINGGLYEVFHGSKDTPLGTYNESNAPGDTIIVVNTGGIGGVKYCKDAFWCSDGSFWLGHSKKVNNKFIYYYISQFENYFASQKRLGGVPTIDRSVVESLEIPLPPLSVQEEIVRMLDAMSELQENLEKELEERRKQFAYYRDKLMTFNDLTTPPQSED